MNSSDVLPPSAIGAESVKNALESPASGVFKTTRASYYDQKRAELKRAFVEQMEALKLEEDAQKRRAKDDESEAVGTRLQEGTTAVLRPQEMQKPPTSSEGSSSKPANKKDLSKAERREIQERQRAAKAASKGLAPVRPPSPISPKEVRKVSAGSNLPALAGSERGSTSVPLELFVHLECPATLSIAQRTNPQIHNSILRLAHLYSHFKIVGSDARCIAMLEAFKEVIRSYTPPPGTALSRHLITHLSHQISHLVTARPLSIGMGNAIRHLKSVIARLPESDLSDEQAKIELCARIDKFLAERIVGAGRVIEHYAVRRIKQGDVILTYANSSLVQAALLTAHRQGIEFTVIVVDSRPMYEGRNLLQLLSRSGINCSYVLINAIGIVLKTVTMALLGTNAMLGNGALYGRCGTAMVAMMCRQEQVPVVVCCETYKFSERVMLDSIVSNEMSTLEAHLPPTSHYAPFDFPSTVPQPKCEGKLQEMALLYDVSRPEDVTVIITEAGAVPVESVPVLLRDYKPLQGES